MRTDLFGGASLRLGSVALALAQLLTACTQEEASPEGPTAGTAPIVLAPAPTVPAASAVTAAVSSAPAVHVAASSGTATPTEPSTVPSASAVAQKPPSALARESARYRVFAVAQDDFLNVRQSPDLKAEVVTRLKPGATKVRATGNWERNKIGFWLELNLGETTGWASRYFMVEDLGTKGCVDPTAKKVLREFWSAIKLRDGKALSKVTSPARGLLMRAHLEQKNNRYHQYQIPKLFTSRAEKKWGLGPGGQLISGSFASLMAPRLREITMRKQRSTCGKLPRAFSDAPELEGMSNFSYRLSRPGASPEDWVIGIEYVGGKPYVGMVIRTAR